MGEASELLHSRLGIEDPELVILNVNLKSREGCTESVRFDKCTHGPSLPANKKPRKWFFYLLEEVSKLLCLRLGIEQQGHVFLARKTDELAYCSAEHGLE